MTRPIRVAAIAALVVVLSFIGSHMIYTAQSASPDIQSTCPDGTYRIGGTDAEPVCKNEPSGCPFYENVGPKGCVPPAGIECSDDTYTKCWQVETPTTPATETDYPTDTTTTPPRASSCTAGDK